MRVIRTVDTLIRCKRTKWRCWYVVITGCSELFMILLTVFCLELWTMTCACDLMTFTSPWYMTLCCCQSVEYPAQINIPFTTLNHHHLPSPPPLATCLTQFHAVMQDVPNFTQGHAYSAYQLLAQSSRVLLILGFLSYLLCHSDVNLLTIWRWTVL